MTRIYNDSILYIHSFSKLRTTLWPLLSPPSRLDTNLADEAVKVLGVKTRTEAVHVALREIVALKRFKALMKKNAGKLSFAGHRE